VFVQKLQQVIDPDAEQVASFARKPGAVPVNSPLAGGNVTMEIARLTEHDLRSLAEMFRQFWGEDSSLEKMGLTFSRLATNPAYILLAAKHNDGLVGFAMGIICEDLYGET
jgi:hypothetical protein